MSLKRFLQDRRGSITPMFALAIVPVVGLTGAAIDYSRANSVRAAMQQAADSTALMLSKDASTLTASQLSTKASAYFQAMFNRSEAKSLAVTPTYTTTAGSTLIITATASVDSSFMKLMGYPQLNIGTNSTVKWGNQRLRVALALDNTGSMASDGKLTALKTATNSLLTQLKNAASNNGDVYVSIVPFSKNVNVGSSYYTSNWVDWDDWDDDNGHDQSSTTCTTQKTGKNGKSTKKCTTSTNWVPDNHNTWNGCVTDRDQNYDVNATVPTTSNNATLFPAEQYDSCPVKMSGLSYNWTSMTSLVNSMSANGTTNQTIGLVWAWMSLTGGGPFTIPSMDPNYQYKQIIILMSDGLNTENRWNGNGMTQSSQVDARMSAACTNAKAAGLTIYTIHVNTDGDPTSTVLQNCASDTSKFFTVTSAGSLSTVFNTIGTNLTQLRISK